MSANQQTRFVALIPGQPGSDDTKNVQFVSARITVTVIPIPSDQFSPFTTTP